MSEDMIVLHCSPTLAGLKTGNLFSSKYSSLEEVAAYVRGLNRCLGPKGIRVLPARITEKTALIYVYRPQRLKEDFERPAVRRLLDECGYEGCGAEQCVAKLMRRLREGKEFPHEIGLFLGYPPEDVRGFIENKAANCKCIGCWKVYGDEAAARREFAKFNKCTEIYRNLWERGRPIEQLAVAGAACR